MTSTPEIEQHHVSRMRAIAYELAQTSVGRLAGQEELESQGLLVLWELALEWDPEANVPFTAWLHLRMRNRLVDWLRIEYGRPHNGQMSERTRWHLTMNSLDQVLEANDSREDDARADHAALVAQAPSVERIIEDRDELRRLAALPLTDNQRRALFWPVTTGRPPEDLYGATRWQAKVKAYAAIDRPRRMRPYEKRKPRTAA